jgi:hypothetical protein
MIVILKNKFDVLVFVCGPLTSRLIKPLLQKAEPRNKSDFVRGLRQTITGTLNEEIEVK